jgi:hypothetical protein
MKIFEITEVDSKIGTVKVNKGPLKGFIFDPLGDGRIKVTAPDGTSMTATSQADAEKQARKHVRTTTPDTPKKQITPTKNAPTRTNTKIKAKRDVDFKDLKNPPGKDIRPYPAGTPTKDQLGRGDRKKLSRGRAIIYKGKLYTAKQVNAATADAGKMSKLAKLGKDLKAVRSTGDAKDLSKHYWDASENFRQKLTRWIGKKMANQFVAVLNIVAIEDGLDAYLRVVLEEIDKGKTVEERNKIRDDIKKNKNQAVISAQIDLVEMVAKLLTQATVILFLGKFGIAAALKWLALLGLTTGFIGWLAAIVAGGAILWGGSELIVKILDDVGIQDRIEKFLLPWLTPARLNDWGNTADTIQDVVATVAGGGLAAFVDAPVVGVTKFATGGAGTWNPGLGKATYDLISDDLVYEEDTKGKEKQVVQSLYKQYPELVQNFKKGKAQGQKMARATLKAN